MSPLTKGDLSKIRQKHADIPQDALPIDVPDQPSTSGGEAKKGNAQPASIAFAICPRHVGGSVTGLVPGLRRDELMFRDHTKRIGNVTVPCPGSGQPAPDHIQHYREGKDHA